MTGEQVFVWWSHAFDGPFTVALILLVGLAAMLWRAQRSGKLDLARMFTDDAGKESGLRFAILGSWVMSSWYLMATQVKSGGDAMLLATYLLFWSGAPIAAKLIERWDGSFGRSPAPPQQGTP